MENRSKKRLRGQQKKGLEKRKTKQRKERDPISFGPSLDVGEFIFVELIKLGIEEGVEAVTP
jgi:hypothetical protein